MTASLRAGLGLVFCPGLGSAAAPALAQKVDVVHFYTSTSKSLAIRGCSRLLDAMAGRDGYVAITTKRDAKATACSRRSR